MPISTLITFGLAYFALHLLVYVGLLRRIIRSELAIFCYHFFSAIVFTGASLAVALYFGGDAITISVGLIAFHGIYSLSFLELWSLTQGSYSLSMLAAVNARSRLSRESLIEVRASVGDEKKANRLAGLLRWSLVAQDGNKWHLTARARPLAAFLNLLLWLAAVKEPG